MVIPDFGIENIDVLVAVVASTVGIIVGIRQIRQNILDSIKNRVNEAMSTLTERLDRNDKCVKRVEEKLEYRTDISHENLSEIKQNIKELSDDLNTHMIEATKREVLIDKLREEIKKLEDNIK